MTRALLLSVALLVGGCVVKQPAPTALFQAHGVTVALSVRSGGIVGGELLAVEADAFLIDAVNQAGAPVRVVRVPKRDVREGAAYVGQVVATDVRQVVTTPPGLRRVARIRAGGRARGADLVRLSRFPYGVPDDALARLLEARVQTEVAGLDFAPVRRTF